MELMGQAFENLIMILDFSFFEVMSSYGLNFFESLTSYFFSLQETQWQDKDIQTFYFIILGLVYLQLYKLFKASSFSFSLRTIGFLGLQIYALNYFFQKYFNYSYDSKDALMIYSISVCAVLLFKNLKLESGLKNIANLIMKNKRSDSHFDGDLNSLLSLLIRDHEFSGIGLYHLKKSRLKEISGKFLFDQKSLVKNIAKQIKNKARNHQLISYQNSHLEFAFFIFQNNGLRHVVLFAKTKKGPTIDYKTDFMEEKAQSLINDYLSFLEFKNTSLSIDDQINFSIKNLNQGFQKNSSESELLVIAKAQYQMFSELLNKKNVNMSSQMERPIFINEDNDFKEKTIFKTPQFSGPGKDQLNSKEKIVDDKKSFPARKKLILAVPTKKQQQIFTSQEETPEEENYIQIVAKKNEVPSQTYSYELNAYLKKCALEKFKAKEIIFLDTSDLKLELKLNQSSILLFEKIWEQIIRDVMPRSNFKIITRYIEGKYICIFDYEKSGVFDFKNFMLENQGFSKIYKKLQDSGIRFFQTELGDQVQFSIVLNQTQKRRNVA